MATPKPTDHIDIPKPKVSEFSEFSGGLNDSIHAPKAVGTSIILSPRPIHSYSLV